MMAFSANGYSQIYHLKCKYDDGSGNEKFKINTNTKEVVWSNESKEEVFRIINYYGSNHKIRAFRDLGVSVVSQINEAGKKPSKDMMVYHIDLESLDIELFDIINGYSNRAEVVNYLNLGQKLFVDEKHNERFFQPSQEQIDNSTRGKNILQSREILQDSSNGYAHVLKCVSY